MSPNLDPLHRGVMAMPAATGKRVARVKIGISKRAVDALEPGETSWIANSGHT